ncbi:cellulase family glycosylhydrolase [Christiangramia sp.]|uniref:cellulase family glycosylhydrolase n=1 Tax=Christiangramia sp. TaxID=1931228 RepID=UPI002616680B|nr:cellulase family glycosylhydrolase [Christiangramia sp.]
MLKRIIYISLISSNVLLFIGCDKKSSNSSSEVIGLLPNKIISPSSDFIGGGVEWSAYPHADAEEAEWGLLMTEDKWNTVFERLDFMQPKIVRVLDQANWRYLKGMDNGNPVLDFENQEMQALYKLLDYCEKNDIQVILGEWGQPYKVHDTNLNMQNAFSGATDPKWISIIADHLEHLIKEKGYQCIKYYNLVNEPNGYWSSIDGNWKEWKEAVKMLDSAIASRDLNQVKLMGPDSTPYNNDKSIYKGVEWAEQAVMQLNDVLGAYDVHDYPTQEKVRSGEFQEMYSEMIAFADSVAHKPFVLGEVGFEKYVEPNISRYKADPYASPDSQMRIYDYDYGVDMADVMAQALNAGFDGVIAWGLDDAMHTNGDTGDKTQLKRWGMWNILGEELTGDKSDEDIRPWFYTWALMTRYFKGDMDIIGSNGKLPELVRFVAGKSSKGDITFSVINNSEKDIELPVDVNSFNADGKRFNKYLYSESKRPVDSSGFPIPEKDNIMLKENFKLKLPSKSVVLYTTYNSEGKS